MDKTFQETINDMMRDIRDLKTCRDFKSTARVYSADISVSSPAIGTKFKVTYAPSDGGTLTSITSTTSGAPTVNMVALTPSGDEQVFILCDYIADNWTFTFTSNREIISIAQL